MISGRGKGIAALLLVLLLSGAFIFLFRFRLPVKAAPHASTPSRIDSVPRTEPIPPAEATSASPASPTPTAPAPTPRPAAPERPLLAAPAETAATDTAPAMTAEDQQELDEMLETAGSAPLPAAGTEKNEALREKIATESEKQVVEAWQEAALERHEEEKARDWAGYHTSPEHEVMGLWLMGGAGAIAFYKDGTGQVSYDRDDHKEQTLTGNFYFRYRIKENIMEIIPILTKDSKRTITCHFLIRIKGDNLSLGPYTYTSMDPKKKRPQ